MLAIVTLLAVRWKFPGVKGITTGKDGRASTSKFQAAMWTYVVLFALLSLLWGYGLVELLGNLFDVEAAERLREPLTRGFRGFLDEGLSETYLILLGLPLASAVTSKAITATKVESGSIVKPSKVEAAQAGDPAANTSTAQELVSDDDGSVDLGDFQFLLFNFLAVAYFLVVYFTDPSAGLPDIPPTLLGLTGVTAAAYVSKKAIYAEPPVLLGLLPPSGKPGKKVDVHGERLLSATGNGIDPQLGAVVTFNGVAGEIQGAPTDKLTRVEIPEIAAGPVQVQVVRPPGAKSDELPFSVLEK